MSNTDYYSVVKRNITQTHDSLHESPEIQAKQQQQQQKFQKAAYPMIPFI